MQLRPLLKKLQASLIPAETSSIKYQSELTASCAPLYLQRIMEDPITQYKKIMFIEIYISFQLYVHFNYHSLEYDLVEYFLGLNDVTIYKHDTPLHHNLG